MVENASSNGFLSITLLQRYVVQLLLLRLPILWMTLRCILFFTLRSWCLNECTCIFNLTWRFFWVHRLFSNQAKVARGVPKDVSTLSGAAGNCCKGGGGGGWLKRRRRDAVSYLGSSNTVKNKQWFCSRPPGFEVTLCYFRFRRSAWVKSHCGTICPQANEVSTEAQGT